MSRPSFAQAPGAHDAIASHEKILSATVPSLLSPEARCSFATRHPRTRMAQERLRLGMKHCAGRVSIAMGAAWSSCAVRVILSTAAIVALLNHSHGVVAVDALLFVAPSSFAPSARGWPTPRSVFQSSTGTVASSSALRFCRSRWCEGARSSGRGYLLSAGGGLRMTSSGSEDSIDKGEGSEVRIMLPLTTAVVCFTQGDV